ncbi:hypothetical protein GKG47_09020 [Lactonifactor sp. BIOML-A3]|uniref:hypothetical protein n=1 Tax=unclassified Lactonifactor TaxID=2636670 RepID=UPI0012AFC652|nr:MULTISPECIES: hypothetical protein [unclassified Lactonifactor]MSA02179.1 hypothetical protein [Lactonifactor sp. BIOML-A5]MSA07964.1 hypothetical protein [Lactonifactor sp. BIOML-A4]MSA12580.1 hypothetical protein [Lactonifactor sp. BIOML-A3]MSA16719.1 hypothetical protein [Lactonifactor sp. BIOML-A2]MSA37582.1 hypothetical protein [Lactonifactor sp. BIOML-A1]
MSTYYEYRDVKVMIAHKLMNMEGWKVYGYKEDRSDGMTDYYDPANWGGVAEKNGYILCVNVYGAKEPEEIRKYNYTGFSYDNSITEKIKKLEAMTVEHGASEQEEQSAKLSIERLQKKAEESAENQNRYVVTGIIPGHMANPPRSNWHIEKDGIIIAKGNGILKYAKVDSYFNYSQYKKDYENFKKQSKEEYIKNNVSDLMHHHYYTDIEKATASAESHYNDMKDTAKLIEQFEAFINKLDTTCGGLLEEGDGTVYEKVTVTEYKKENKVFETESGEIKEGQCFILKTGFNYGRSKGYVYRIHRTEYDGKEHFHAYKLNGKLTKECTGRANQANYWSYITDEIFLKWIEKGNISWCEIKEVKTPYEVEKVIKKTIKAEKKTAQKTTTEATEETNIDINGLTFEVSEDTDTRTNEKIYLVKVAEKLSREDYIKVNKYIKSIGGYYSKFKHAFLFKEDPTTLLNCSKVETVTETEEKPTETTETATETPQQEETKQSINYNITEDTHTKTGAKIWIVSPDTELNKQDFAEIKRKFATLQGFYSSFKHGFIFKYDPTDLLTTA